jgi:XTP/dITP diphosphohydrolase
MKKVILATTNKGKMKEFQVLLEPLDIQIITIDQLEQELLPEVIEDGETFEENALKKANAFYEQYRLPTLADDSGLEVDSMGGAPGIYSARYAGDGKSDQDNVDKLLHEMQGIIEEQRNANFTCAIAYVDGGNPPLITRGICRGRISVQPQGEHGFGYDPVFYLPELNKTMAQLSKEEKNQISHRFQALKKLAKELKQRLLTNEAK